LKNFAIIGVGGYIAPRHLKAIRDTGNVLLAAVDPNDSVGILDQFNLNTSFFTEIERFDRHLYKLRKSSSENEVQYISICSPNHLHDAHIRLALRIGADVICEKPLVLNPWNLDALADLEKDYERRVYTVLQSRVHSPLVHLRETLNEKTTHFNTKHEVELTYIATRGLWYNFSWKGDANKSGGVGTNIGIHFFDLLVWFFGREVYSEVHLSEARRMSGFLELENANVRWYLSVDGSDLPPDVKGSKKTTLRSIRIDGEEVEFTDGFADLHTKVYENTINGLGFGIEDARESIELVYRIRNKPVIEKIEFEKMHKLLKLKQ